MQMMHRAVEVAFSQSEWVVNYHFLYFGGVVSRR
jgi:hypothetical protein